MREEEEPKKRGWFSRKKKTPATPPKVSRPPSAKSISSHHRKTSSLSTDDDLPPREATPVRSSTPTPSSRPDTPTVNGDANDIEKDVGESVTPGGPAAVNPLPKHAGFDLSAMKAVLAEAQSHPEELKMPAPNRFPAPPVHEPTNRSESAPPPLPPKSPGVVTPRSASQVNLHEQPVAGPSSSQTNLPSAFSRSVSLGEPDSADESDEEVDRTAYSAMFPTARRDGGALNAPSQLSFGNPYGSAWSTEPDRSPAPTFGSPFGGFQDASSFGKSAGNFGAFSPRPPENPFTPPESSMMSFGGTDGTITFTPPTRNEAPDPWSVPAPSFNSYTPKKSSSTVNFNLNPWQS